MAVLSRIDGLQHIDHHDGVLEIPSLPDMTVLLVEVGSTAHGTGLPRGESRPSCSRRERIRLRSPLVSGRRR
jgi:hypothetical protein